ncbi:membrane protein [Paenibacillus sp. D9]|uniref:DUF421 domain-containing protein n=1 Tax=Paenibacillus sp. D9 TaxID=665792 RepID=UPI00061F3D95|nr:DUF421 domain-containing protein [Paenibacillus sp. D9]KKC47261.1 membrane protein [Paenibacillus sp. D9]
MEYGSLLLRTVLIYFVVFLIMRLMGKREIGKMSVFDLVISFMIAEIAVLVIEDTKRPVIEGIVPMAVLMIIQVLIAYIGLKNRKLRLLFDGKPSVIIADGKLNQKEMKKQRYNLDDLMLQLRENQVARVADVEFAILETSGKLSVIPKESQSPSSGQSQQGQQGQQNQQSGQQQSGQQQSQQGSSSGGEQKQGKHGKQDKQDKQDKNNEQQDSSSSDITFPSAYRFETLPVPLIMDGRVMDHNLEKLEKNRLWLKQQLRKRGLTEWNQVFFCTIDHKGELFVDENRRKK